MRSRDGFTLLELVIVLMITSMVMGLVAHQYNIVQKQRALANARDAMILTGFRARAEAMRTGELVFMYVRPDSNLVRVATADDEVLHTLDADEYGAAMVGDGLSVCYTARGYALPGCTSITGVRRLGFTRGGDTTAVVVMPLGQVRRYQ